MPHALPLQIDDVGRRSKMLTKFSKLCRELRQPSRWQLLTNSKHQVVYNLVAAFVNKFSGESEYIKSHCASSKWGECKLERVQDDASRCSDASWGFEDDESNWKRGRRNEESGWFALSGSTGSIESDIQEDRDKGHREGFYDAQLYTEVFYTRIHHLLGDTADRIAAAVEGINHLSRRDF